MTATIRSRLDSIHPTVSTAQSSGQRLTFYVNLFKGNSMDAYIFLAVYTVYTTLAYGVLYALEKLDQRN